MNKTLYRILTPAMVVLAVAVGAIGALCYILGEILLYATAKKRRRKSNRR